MSDEARVTVSQEEVRPCRAKHCDLNTDECRVFVCPGCSEHCPFPTKVFEELKPGQAVSDRMSTCGCGMTHKLTMAKGAVHEVPPGVTCDPDWLDKKCAREQREREDAVAAEQARVLELRKAGKCIHCEGTGKGPGLGG